MNKLRLAALVILAASVVGAAAPAVTSGRTNYAHQNRKHPDRVISTKVIKGTVVRFEQGDYLWVVVKDRPVRKYPSICLTSRARSIFWRNIKGRF